MGPSIVMIDEVEKALSGVAASGSGDSGVSARMFGTLLSWLSDRESDSFVICTANDVSRLPPEFSRAERFDGLFFLDLPGREQKDQIWELYARTFQIAQKQRRPDDTNWDRRRDPRLLSIGSVARCADPGSRRERGACRVDGCRIGGTTAQVGQRQVPIGRRAGSVSGRRGAPSRTACQSRPVE
jgi:hypothetical protein